MLRVKSMTSLSLAFPGLERWERPTSAPSSASGFQPGRLAHGPDEKSGLIGRRAGLSCSDNEVSFHYGCSRPGLTFLFSLCER